MGKNLLLWENFLKQMGKIEKWRDKVFFLIEHVSIHVVSCIKKSRIVRQY
jgi:hypothetical protein